ncbi:MAG: ABC transporter [Candidatus Dadabacteria bacterium RIFCSPHIGHO2_12_FULL_53_21]|nr:MAG: ABC transporter [Candidatus Dadabacteria bacterium RIFCSPHIGHO2_12_FULL_53_21]
MKRGPEKGASDVDFPQIFSDLFLDYTLRTVALGSAVIGIVSGALGSYAVLRKQSLLGDAMSHAALPGIALAFLLTGSKMPLVLIIGAALAGWIATLLIISIVNSTRVKYDTALGMVLSVFFGFGLVLLTIIQKRPDATQAGLDKFLFGQAAALLERDVVTMGILGASAILITMLLWKEFKLLSFDPDFASTLGFPVRVLDVLLTTLIVIAIVLGLQTVGVVLMSAMIVAPAASARQWTDNLGVMIVLSSLFGALAGISGAVLSASVTRLPTGPTIVVCVSAIVIFSMLLAPRRGILWRFFRERRQRGRLRLEGILEDLYSLALEHKDPEHAHSLSVLRLMSAGKGGVERSLEILSERGLVRAVSPGEWALTRAGIEEAERAQGERGGGQDER